MTEAALYIHNLKQVMLTWPNSSYKHLDRIPYLQQSMDIDDFGIDSSHNDSLEIDFYNSWGIFRSKQLSHKLIDVSCMSKHVCMPQYNISI